MYACVWAQEHQSQLKTYCSTNPRPPACRNGTEHVAGAGRRSSSGSVIAGRKNGVEQPRQVHERRSTSVLTEPKGEGILGSPILRIPKSCEQVRGYHSEMARLHHEPELIEPDRLGKRIPILGRRSHPNP